MASNKTDRFLGKRFSYKGGIIEVVENLGTVYEDDRAVFYLCKILQETRDASKGKKIEMRYQALRALLLAQGDKPKTSSRKRA